MAEEAEEAEEVKEEAEEAAEEDAVEAGVVVEVVEEEAVLSSRRPEPSLPTCPGELSLRSSDLAWLDLP